MRGNRSGVRGQILPEGSNWKQLLLLIKTSVGSQMFRRLEVKKMVLDYSKNEQEKPNMSSLRCFIAGIRILLMDLQPWGPWA